MSWQEDDSDLTLKLGSPIIRIVLGPPALIQELLDRAYVAGWRCGCDVTLLILGCMQILHTHIVIWIKEISITSTLPCEFDGTEVSLKSWYLDSILNQISLHTFTPHIMSFLILYSCLSLRKVLQQKFHVLPIKLKFTQIYGPKVQYCQYEEWQWTQFFQHSHE
jgi:hypothetical protein